MKKIFFLLLVLMCQFAVAQSFMSITASSIYNTGGTLLPAGTLIWQPVDSTGNPVSYQIGGGGQQINFPTVCSISNGAVVGLCQVANTAATNPLNVCFSVTIKNANNQLVLGGPNSGYTCVQPQPNISWCGATSCNFDQYVPNLPAAIIAKLPPPTTNSLGGVYAYTCPNGQVANAILTTGFINCITGGGGGGGGLQDPGANGIVYRDAFNVTRIAATADVNTALGYTAANDSLVVHLANNETLTGIKTFSQTILGSVSGNSGTTNSFSGTPTLCPIGQAPLGILANGNATGCNPLTGGLQDPGSSGVVKRTTFDQTTIAVAADINASLGYTAANDASVVHIAGAETITGVKTFSQSIIGALTGNASTSSALAATPTLCPSGQAAMGILANGNATGCFSLTAGLGDPGSNGIVYRDAFNTTRVATATDIGNTLTYTPANDSLVVHLAGTETITGSKTFSATITGSISGNAATATALAATPTICSPGQAARGVLANGNSTGCGVLGLPDPGANGIVTRTAFDVTGVAGPTDIENALGFTPANDSLVVHLSGSETITGTKTFSAKPIIVGLTNSTSNYLPISPASNASPSGTLIIDAPSGYLQLQADSGAGANQGGTVNLQASTGPSSAASATISEGSSSITLNSTGITITSGSGLKTVLQGLATLQIGAVGISSGSETFVGSTSGSQTVSCSSATCPSIQISNLILSTALPVSSGGTGVINVPTSGQLLVGNSGGTAYGVVSMSGDCSLTSAGIITCTKTNGTLFGPLATVITPFQTNGTNNASQTGLNFLTSTVNTVGLTITPSNPSTTGVKFEITGASYTGNSATATALAATPAQCSTGQFATGITASGTANCATPTGSGNVIGTGLVNTQIAVATSSTGITSYAGLTSDSSGNVTAKSLTTTGCSGCAGAISFPFGTDPGLGSNIAITVGTSGTPYNIYLPTADSSGYFQCSDTAHKLTCIWEPNINLAADVGSTVLPLVNGGTGNSTQSGALSALMPTPLRTGDIIYWNGTQWLNFGGNNAGGGGTGFFTENGTGSPGWVIIPIPVGDGGTGLTNLTANTIYKGNGTGSLQPSSITDSGSAISTKEPLVFSGITSGTAGIGVAAIAGTPSQWLLPITDPTSGQVLSAGAPSGGRVQLSWISGGGGSGTINAANQYSIPYYSSSGSASVLSGLAAPTTNGLYNVTFNITGSTAVSPAISLVGVPVNPITSASYTFQYSDRASRITFSNASAVAVTLPQAGSTGFTSNFVTSACDIGAGTATITPTTSTISYTNGSSYTSGATTLPLSTGQCSFIYSDNTNYYAILFSGGSGGGGGVNTGTVPQLAYYGTTTTVSSAANTSIGNGTSAPVLSLTGTSLADESLFVNCTTPTNNCVTFQIGGTSQFYVNTSGVNISSSTVNLAGGITFQNLATNSTNYSAGLNNNSDESTSVATLHGSDMTAANTHNAGSAVVRGGDLTATGAATGAAGSLTVRGGNCGGTGACTAAKVTLQPGALINATPSASAVEGTIELDAAAELKGTTVTAGNAECYSASFKIADCLTVAQNLQMVGIGSSTNGGSAYLQTIGESTLNLDATYTYSYGDIICTSPSLAAEFTMNAKLACPSGTRMVGYARTAGTSLTTVQAVLQIGSNPTTAVAVKTSQTSALSSTTLVTTGTNNALWNIGASLVCDSSSSAATITFTITWTDPSSTSQSYTSTTATCTTLGASSYVDFGKRITVKGGTNISYSTAIVNTPTYDLRIDATQITAN